MAVRLYRTSRTVFIEKSAQGSDAVSRRSGSSTTSSALPLIIRSTSFHVPYSTVRYKHTTTLRARSDVPPRRLQCPEARGET